MLKIIGAMPWSELFTVYIQNCTNVYKVFLKKNQISFQNCMVQDVIFRAKGTLNMQNRINTPQECLLGVASSDWKPVRGCHIEEWDTRQSYS